MRTPAVTSPLGPLAGAARRALGGLRRRARDLLRGETAGTLFDLHDLRAVNAVLVPHGVPPLTADPRQVEGSPAGAVRFSLGLLATSPRLRRRFPAALSAGPDGAFCRWLTGAGAAGVGLSPAAADRVRAAFAGGPGERVKRVLELRQDLREVFPFGTTPHPDRGRFLGWLMTHGAADFGLTPEEALWFLFERDEAPDRGLVATYLVRPDWQAAVPHALTPWGWPALLAHLRTRHGVRGRWARRARLDPPFRPWDDLTLLRHADPKVDAAVAAAPVGDADGLLARVGRHVRVPGGGWADRLREDVAAGLPAAPGANVVGHFRYPSGLQEAALGVVAGLRRAGVRTSLRDLPVDFPADWRDRDRYQGLELFDTTVYVAAVNTFPATWYPRAGLHPRPGVRRVAVWYWELEDLPAEWVGRLGWADEVWAPTEFVAAAFRKHVRVPVVPMLPGVELPAFDPKPRADIGLPADRFVFLVTFDMASTLARKNPLAAVAAFRRAFRPADKAHLAVKVSRGFKDPAGLAELAAACRAAGATLIDRVLPRADALALLAAADCYVSLHRSEGLGLGMAESMLLGKPVVATGYSGNVDFMPADVARLVSYDRVPVPADLPPYPRGCLWADPSVDHAADLMRRVFDHPDEARALGDRARAHAERVLSVEAAGRRMAARLREMERANGPGRGG